MRRISIITMALVSIGAFSGCAKKAYESSTQQALQDVNNGQTPAQSDPQKGEVLRPYCELQAPAYILNTRILSFEITNQSNVNVGFNLMNGFLQFLGVQLRWKSGQMALTMDVTESLNPDLPLVTVPGVGKSKEKEFKIDINAQQAGVDFGYYSRTPLAVLTERGLADGLSKAQSQLMKQSLNWHTIVVAQPAAQHLIIPAGLAAGLRVGDVLEIIDVEHSWNGEPCNSEHLIARQVGTTTLRAKVAQLEQHAAVLVMENGQPFPKVELGSYVVLKSFTGTKEQLKTRKLLHAARIGQMASGVLSINASTRLDLATFAKEQIKPLLDDYGFVLRP